MRLHYGFRVPHQAISIGARRVMLVAAGAAVVTFATNVISADVRPTSSYGFAYGLAATILLIGIAAYGGRRKWVTKRGYGSAFTWLRFHLYGGLLFLLLMLMHSAFRIPSGPLTFALWLASVWVALSGVIGVAMQRWIPRALASGLTMEASYERIPELIEDLSRKVEALLPKCSDMVRSFYDEKLSSAFARPVPRLAYFRDAAGAIALQTRGLVAFKEFLPSEEQQQMQELTDLYATKLELDAHYSLQSALRLWHYTHAPASIALGVLLGIHLVAVYHY